MYNFIQLSIAMDLIKNPYSPGAGSPPPELVGRDPVLEQARILIGRIKNKRSEKSMLLTGLRGVGKTVLLNEIDRMAKESGCHTISIEAHENKALGPMIAPYLRSLLFDLDRMAGVRDKVKRGLAVLRSFIGVKEQREYAILTAEISEATFGLKPSEHKKLKSLKKENLRDHMTDLELIFTMLGEASTTEITIQQDAQ